ncbi:hypothetical protein [Glycomyces sp. NPDC021274]|uniref:hypothetical protein n=1 Tax=Glycomyces sp. NPDC021274 TaxID=3155120 RepID=UPI0034050EBC
MSTEDGQFGGEHPFTRPEGSDASMFIQWKGTDVCMDFMCQCGANVHGDGYFAYNVECGACGAFYELGNQVIAKRVTEPDGACLYLADNKVDNTPPETVTLPGGQEATVIATVAEGKVLWTEEPRRLATCGPVKGPGRLVGDSVPAQLSPGEAMLPGPHGTVIHIQGAYGDQPAEVTQISLDDIEGERT